MTLFNEIYSVYFNAVAEIVGKAIEGNLDEKEILRIVKENAFSESMLMILPAIKNEEWLIVNKDYHTPIKHHPKMPLTILQKRWMKALFSDPRIALFDIDVKGLEDIEPLFSYDDFVFFDRYSDSDPYGDKDYVLNFKTILKALKQKREIHIQYRSRQGNVIEGRFIPNKLEYSSKDDKFRLEVIGGRPSSYINLGRIQKCELLDSHRNEERELIKSREHSVTFTLMDERKALDRVMIHFSDFRKETIRLKDNCYQVQLWYEALDETEVLIRILSFGPMLKVTNPESFVSLIKKRLLMQTQIKK